MQNEKRINGLETQVRTLKRIVCLVCCLFVVSCGTTSMVYQRDLSGVKTFSFERYQTGMEDTLENMIHIMEQKGYVYAPNDRTGIVLTLGNTDSSLYHLEYGVTAWYKSRPILVIKADNSGWGTGIAPGIAKKNLWKKLVKQLQEKMPAAVDSQLN